MEFLDIKYFLKKLKEKKNGKKLHFKNKKEKKRKTLWTFYFFEKIKILENN